MQTKICTKCKIEKSLSEFYKHKIGKFGVDSVCKICQHQNYLNRNYDNKIYRSEYVKNNKDKAKNNHLKLNFGITLEWFNKKLKEQNGVCAICGKSEYLVDPRNNKIRELCVDHDHKTGKIRGLLCGKCNQAIGLLNDNIQILQSAINYLNKE